MRLLRKGEAPLLRENIAFAPKAMRPPSQERTKLLRDQRRFEALAI